MASDFLDLQIQTRMDPKAWLKRSIDERYHIVRSLYQIRRSHPQEMAFFRPEYMPIVSVLFKPFFPLPQARNTHDGEYFGHCLNSKRHGRGTMNTSDDCMYLGDFADDKYHGRGALTWPDGTCQDGWWVNGKFKSGKLMRADGSVYDGEYKNGLTPHGQGKYSWPKGTLYSRYEGSWQEGKPSGFGVMIFSDSSIYEGAFKEGKPHGKGKKTDSNGVYDGEWVAGEMHGFGRKTHNCGAYFEGQMVHGKPGVGINVIGGKVYNEDDPRDTGLD
jgi:hypothetical protein